MSENDNEIHEYGDPGIASKNHKVEFWLKCVYFTLPIWGIIQFAVFWNGVGGWFDRGYWFELEKAANTTYPYKNYNEPENP